MTLYCHPVSTTSRPIVALMALGGEVIYCSIRAYPNISRWPANRKALKGWATVNEAFYKCVVEPNKGKEFVRV